MQERVISPQKTWKFKDKWVLVIGTGIFELVQTQLLAAEAIGQMLADEGLGVFTGSRPGVDHVTARSFSGRLKNPETGSPPIPQGNIRKRRDPDHQYGTAVEVGKHGDWTDFAFNRIFAVIIIGGGILANETYKTALRMKVPVIPLPQTGGTAQAAYEQLTQFSNYGIPAQMLEGLNIPLTSPADAARLAANVNELCRGIIDKRISGEISSDHWLLTTAPLKAGPSVIYQDGRESYGEWLVTRGRHQLFLPAQYKMALYPVTNEFFNAFIEDEGYQTERYWKGVSGYRRSRLTRKDGKTPGPKSWGEAMPANKAFHPVRGVCYHEAIAFCRWLQHKYPVKDWTWTLPTEDMWEFAARTEEGRFWPWGSTFKPGCCNSVETKLDTSSSIFDFPNGKSREGCYDMAGNVWELVDAALTGPEECVLRGGSYKNTQLQVRSHLRLFGVHKNHRAPDFGFRCALIPAQQA